jgi:hypothetical protein
MTNDKIRVSSKSQSGGQTANTIVNSTVINNIFINANWSPLSDDDAIRLIDIFTNEYNAKDVADILHGAWFALELSKLGLPNSNPDYLAQIAHSMREFIEKAPKILNTTPVEVKGGGLKSAVIGLSGKWSKATANTATVDTVEWSGQIDGPFKKVLKAFSDFFGVFDASHVPRGHLNRAVLTHLNGSIQPLREDMLKELLKRYKELDDYFKGVAHHNITPATDDEVRNKIIELQKIMLDLKSPDRSMSIETLDSIDAYIIEGES